MTSLMIGIMSLGLGLASTPTVFGEEPQHYYTYSLDSCTLSLSTSKASIWFELLTPGGERWTVIDLDRETHLLELTSPEDESSETIQLVTRELLPGTAEHAQWLQTLSYHISTLYQGNPFANAPENPELQEAIEYIEKLLCELDFVCR